MADLYGLSAADRDVLLRMIARERANYSANVRSLAPVPKKKIEWKPSTEIKWFRLQEPLYPQSDLSPYNDEIWSCEARAMEWNPETKQWDLVSPEELVTIYSTGNIYGMTDMVIPCQKRDDGWEPVASAPPDNVVLGQRPQLSGDLGNTSNGVDFEETTTTPTDKSGFLRFKAIADRFADPSGYFPRCIDIGDAFPSLDYETDGEIEVNYTGIYEITFAAEITAERYLFASPAGRTSTINTGAASAGTAHTHPYQSPWNGYNYPVKFRPAMWRRPVSGSYAEQTSASWWMPEISLNILGTSSQSMAYYGRIVQRLEEGETLGMKVYSAGLAEATCSIRYWTLGFHLLQPGWGTIS